MDENGQHYVIHGYLVGGSFLETRREITVPDDDMIIEAARKLIAPDPDENPDETWFADIFHCHEKHVRLVGTWEARPDAKGGATMHWHREGWAQRPRPSKEKALRFLQGLGRPA